MARGTLRIYLGASPGVGKTYRMLGEGVRRRDRGADVVIGVIETHGRQQTAGQMRDLEVVPLRPTEYRGTTLHELDVEAVLERNPKVVLIDEYAHTNAPGLANEKRWQDVEQVLDAGIDVVSTMNIQHLESLNDVISRITGIVQRETVPDDVVRRADQLELVDLAPEAIRRRLAHGNIYPAERIDAAMSNYFRPGNLGALRELALLWVADRVEDSLHGYLDASGISGSWETRERVVVGITGRPGGEGLIRRASRMAGRVGGDLIGVHVSVDDGLTQADAESLAAQRRLVIELGGTAHDAVGHDTADTLVSFAARAKATQLVLGATRRSRWHELTRGSLVARVTRLAAGIDIHVIADDAVEPKIAIRRSLTTSVLDRRRFFVAWGLTVLGLPAMVGAIVPLRDHISLSTALLLVLAFVLAIAAIGGRLVAGVSAVAGSLLVNWYFVLPYHTFDIADVENLVALVVFVGVAVGVGSLVVIASQRAVDARRARLEAEALARSTTSLAAEPDPLPTLMAQLLTTFDLDGVRIRSGPNNQRMTDLEVGSIGERPSTSVPLSTSATDGSRPALETFGRALSHDDERLLRVLADQLALALDRQRLATEAADAVLLADVDAVRTALLRAVSHDLRTPLASIKAMVSGLRDPDVTWKPEQLAEALAMVEDETDRLNRLVGNLLDASRLQIGMLAVNVRPANIAAVVAAALQSINASPDSVVVDLPAQGATVLCDSALLERSLANVIANALRHSTNAHPVRIEAGTVGERLHLRVVDRGPGIASKHRHTTMQPFQRLGDQHVSSGAGLGDGVGLGLSIAQGFVDAMDGTLSLDDTPGGGLTVTIALRSTGEVAA